MTLIAQAPAKLNLGLWIRRRRPDGYHDLLTVFQAIDLCDTLEVIPKRRGITLRTDDPRLPTGPKNLVIKAARLLRQDARSPGRRRSVSGPLGADFFLRKRIPEGAGLGGGSSDAAAALLSLNRLWGLHLPLSRLGRLALQVGSDVPFFLIGGAAVGRGRGDRLTPLRMGRTLHFVLVHSSRKISTKWAYSQFKKGLTGLRPPPKIAALSSGNTTSGVPIKDLYNALEGGLTTRYPDIVARKQRLLALGARAAHLTGSGSTVYGIFRRRADAGEAARRLKHEGYDVNLCQSVGHGVILRG